MILPNTSPWDISFEVRVPSTLPEHWLSLHAIFFPRAFLLLMFFFRLFFPFQVFILVFISFCSPQGSHILGELSVTEP